MSAPPETLTDEHKEFLLDLFTTALEGGIGYWSECSDYHWEKEIDGSTAPIPIPAPVADLDGFYAVIHPLEEEGGWGIFGDPKGTAGDCEEDTMPLRIDLEVMHRGARLMNWYVQGLVDGRGKPVPLENVKPWPKDHYHWQFVKAYNSYGKDGDYDAGTADMIVQFGLFGEVVYG